MSTALLTLSTPLQAFRPRVASSLLVATLLTLASTSTAAAALVPIEYNASGDFSHVACPSAVQCTATEDTSGGQAGQEVTFNPQAPRQNTPVTIDTGSTTSAPSCPSSSQCTVVDVGNEITFNPQAPGRPTPVTIFAGPRGGLPLYAVSCPSLTLCVATGSGVGLIGQEVTFNPQAPDAPTVYSLDGGLPMQDIACPAVSQCTGVGFAGHETTFDPSSPGNPAPVTVDSGHLLGEVQCPSVSQCTATDSTGGTNPGEVTFNPTSPSGASRVALGSTGIAGLSCPASTLCIGSAGATIVAFNPLSPALKTIVSSSPPGPTGFNSISCASTTQCTAVSTGQATTFDPGASGSAVTTTIQSAPGGRLVAVSCPSRSLCTALDAAAYSIDRVGFLGAEVTYDPRSPGRPLAVPLPIVTNSVEGGYGADLISCPSTSQCTAIGDGGTEVTFNPRAPANPKAVFIGRESGEMIACPSVTQCTFALSNRAVTFNPRSPQHRSSIAVGSAAFRGELACPSVRQCSVVAGDGVVVTFNPKTRRRLQRITVDPQGWRYNGAVYMMRSSNGALSCPTSSQCTVVASYQRTSCTSVAEVYAYPFPACVRALQSKRTGPVFAFTFDPRRSHERLAVVRNGPYVGMLTCPSASRCVTIFGDKQELTFDPQAPRRSRAATVLPRYNVLEWLSCPAALECTAVTGGSDGATFNPR